MANHRWRGSTSLSIQALPGSRMTGRPFPRTTGWTARGVEAWVTKALGQRRAPNHSYGKRV